ncbi:MAG TPA: hypothetical protein VN442_06045, partial [Bryobacteraceae bacterium]|nr:hypothetical protein [Bryobacteraceae bacterium]
MKLQDALLCIAATAADAPVFPVNLALGSTPEPLSVFLSAHLQKRLVGRRVRVGTGRFGDMCGNLERSLLGPAAATVLIIEWSDLDARLGLRDSGRWGRDVVPDILTTSETRLQGLVRQLESAPSGSVLVVVPP